MGRPWKVLFYFSITFYYCYCMVGYPQLLEWTIYYSTYIVRWHATYSNWLYFNNIQSMSGCLSHVYLFIYDMYNKTNQPIILIHYLLCKDFVAFYIGQLHFPYNNYNVYILWDTKHKIALKWVKEWCFLPKGKYT